MDFSIFGIWVTSVALMRFSILCLGFLDSLPFFSLRLQASGFHNDSIEVGGRTRSYLLFVTSKFAEPGPGCFRLPWNRNSPETAVIRKVLSGLEAEMERTLCFTESLAAGTPGQEAGQVSYPVYSWAKFA